MAPKDPKLQKLFAFVAQYWPPKPRKPKQRTKEQEQEQAEEQQEEQQEEETLEEEEEQGEEEAQTEDECCEDNKRDDKEEMEKQSMNPALGDLGLMKSMGVIPNSPLPPCAYISATSAPQQPVEELPVTAATAAPDLCSSDYDAKLLEIEFPGLDGKQVMHKSKSFFSREGFSFSCMSKGEDWQSAERNCSPNARQHHGLNPQAGFPNPKNPKP